MIAGGGNIGATLAQSLESKFQVKIIEMSYSRCRVLSEQLKDSIVLNGSAAEPQLLYAENIEQTDVFCALTNNDESIIMMSMLAKRMDAKKVITLITYSARMCLRLGFASGLAFAIATAASVTTIGRNRTLVANLRIALDPGAAPPVQVAP